MRWSLWLRLASFVCILCAAAPTPTALPAAQAHARSLAESETESSSLSADPDTVTPTSESGKAAAEAQPQASSVRNGFDFELLQRQTTVATTTTTTANNSSIANEQTTTTTAVPVEEHDKFTARSDEYGRVLTVEQTSTTPASVSLSSATPMKLQAVDMTPSTTTAAPLSSRPHSQLAALVYKTATSTPTPVLAGNASHENVIDESTLRLLPEKRAKFISENSTNAQQLSWPNAAEVWSLASLKALPKTPVTTTTEAAPTQLFPLTTPTVAATTTTTTTTTAKPEIATTATPEIVTTAAAATAVSSKSTDLANDIDEFVQQQQLQNQTELLSQKNLLDWQQIMMHGALPENRTELVMSGTLDATERDTQSITMPTEADAAPTTTTTTTTESQPFVEDERTSATVLLESSNATAATEPAATSTAAWLATTSSTTDTPNHLAMEEHETKTNASSAAITVTADKVSTRSEFELFTTRVTPTKAEESAITTTKTTTESSLLPIIAKATTEIGQISNEVNLEATALKNQQQKQQNQQQQIKIETETATTPKSTTTSTTIKPSNDDDDAVAAGNDDDDDKLITKAAATTTTTTEVTIFTTAEKSNTSGALENPTTASSATPTTSVATTTKTTTTETPTQLSGLKATSKVNEHSSLETNNISETAEATGATTPATVTTAVADAEAEATTPTRGLSEAIEPLAKNNVSSIIVAAERGIGAAQPTNALGETDESTTKATTTSTTAVTTTTTTTTIITEATTAGEKNSKNKEGENQQEYHAGDAIDNEDDDDDDDESTTRKTMATKADVTSSSTSTTTTEAISTRPTTTTGKTTAVPEAPLISLLDDSTTTTTTTTTTTIRTETVPKESTITTTQLPTSSTSTTTTTTTTTIVTPNVEVTESEVGAEVDPELEPTTFVPSTSTSEDNLSSMLPKNVSLAGATPISGSIGNASTHGVDNLQQPNSTNAQGETDVNVIIAITVSVIGVVALILLVAFLYLMRKRQKQMSYGQRCRPVSLDAYSLDNVSVLGSVRRKGRDLRASKRTYGNAAFDDPALRHNLLSANELAKFLERRSSIFEEFRDVPQIIARADEVPAGCEDKNRYANVIPLPETRVVLQREGNGDDKTEYINANYVRGPRDAPNYYIACQAPMESTNADFWRMIWEQQSRVIIQATDLIENGVEKCAEYLPPSATLDNHSTYGDFQVMLKNREVKDKYAISTLMLKRADGLESRELTHYWYKWPETGVPMEEAPIIAMLLEARSSLKSYAIEQANELKEKSSTLTLKSAESSLEMDTKLAEEGSTSSSASHTQNNEINGNVTAGKGGTRNQQGPLTIHCSPGTGRTGTIIACDMAIRSLETPKRSVDIPQLVYYVRRGRASAVQTKEQYEFIYKVANMYATKITNLSNDN